MRCIVLDVIQKKGKYQYEKLIIDQIKSEISLSEKQIKQIYARLNKATSEELERVYESFYMFGVQDIFDNIVNKI